MRINPVAGLAALLAASASVFAAEPVDVSPLVNDRTVLVGQVDLNQIKLKPAADWLIDTATRAGVPQEAMTTLRQGGAGLAMLGQPTVDGLKRAGVTTLGVVVQFNDGPDFGFPPILLLAVPKPAEPQKAIAALAALGLRNGEKGNLLVFSPNLPPGVLGKMTPTDRPDLAVKPGAAALSATFAVSPPIKAELLAKNTKPDPDTEAFARDVDRYLMTIDTAAGPHFTMVAEAKSPEAAAKIKELVLKERPGADGKSWAAIAKTLPLSVNGSTVVLDARQAEIDAFAKAVVPAMTRARQTAQQVQSASNMRQILMGMQMHAADNKGQTPASIDAMAKYLGGPAGQIPPALLTNASRPELGTSGYVYVRTDEKIQKIKNPATRVALYEAGDFGEGINVGFWDGHVEGITDEAKFKSLLEASQPAK